MATVPENGQAAPDDGRQWLMAAAIALAPVAIVLAAALLPSSLPDLKGRPAAWCSFDFAKERTGCPKPFATPSPAAAGTAPASAAAGPTAPPPAAAGPTTPPPAVTGTPAPGAVGRKPQNEDQAKTLELALRMGFATASNVMRLTSIIVFAGAAGFFFSQSGMRNAKAFGAWIALVAICTILGTVILSQDGLTKSLVVGAIGAAETQVLGGNGKDSLEASTEINLIFGFAGSGALLAMLCSLVWRRADHAGAIRALQFAMVMGGALFSAASYANAQAVAWAKGVLDDNTMSFAALALDQLPAYWGVVGSISLVAVGGLSYIFVSNDEEPSDQNGSAFALKTSDGSDFKFFGWLVNAILVLSPIWAGLKIPTTSPF